ncbi:MAG: conjugal transfer protein TraI [Crocinitomicaceae bacterium]|nr:conjugal transfer protein TraI [Crocinitomicaceae bacterium]
MKKYVKKVVVGIAFMALLVTPTQQVHAGGGIIEIIKQVIVKVIKAADLQVQRLQSKTIGLQNTQKQIENFMTKLKLNEISDWTRKQKEQYQKYFDELQKVKSIISDYQRVRNLMQMQLRMVDQHARMWQMLRSDSHFKPSEMAYMEQVYTGMLNQSLQNVKQLRMVITSNVTKMSDGKRIEIINETAEQMQRNYDDMQRFNTDNARLSLSRAKEEQDAQRVKRMYGID